jgi:hypothetical protein
MYCRENGIPINPDGTVDMDLIKDMKATLTEKERRNLD